MEKMLYVSLIDWYFIKQRPQHFAEFLSARIEILYVCMVSWQSKYSTKHFKDEKMYSSFMVNDNLRVRRLKHFPLNRLRFVSTINSIIYKREINLMIKKLNPEILWITHPTQYELINKSFSGKVIYDCMDNYSQFSVHESKNKEIEDLEKKIVQRADLIFTSSNSLYTKISRYNFKNKVITVKNAANFRYFNDYLNSATEKKRPLDISRDKKIIGYFGAISSWFDIDFLLVMADKFRNCEFVIIGPINNDEVVKRTRKFENIKLLGPKMYSELAEYLYFFDVCIMPFILNDIVKDVNPVKIYEYLSMGKPVVVKKYSEIMEFEEYIYLVDNNDEFSSKLSEALEENSQHLVDRRVDFARHNTWESRAQTIYNAIAKL